MISARNPFPIVPVSRVRAMTAAPGRRVGDPQAAAPGALGPPPAPPPMPVAAIPARPDATMRDAHEPPVATSAGAQENVAFTGTRAAFAGLLARGSLLTLPTLGLYRFWLITDIRRHLWGNTVIAGEPLEYAGRGGELLGGLLIGMAVLIPLNLLLTLLGLTSFGKTITLGIFVFLGMAGLRNFAEFRGYAYRVTRTRYRGIPGSLDADVSGYVKRCYAWDLAVLLSFGLAAPFRRASLDRYLIGNTRLGDRKARFSGTGQSLARRVYLAWAVMALAWLVIVKEAVPAFSIHIMQGRPQLWDLPWLLTTTWYTILATIIIVFTFFAVYVAIWHRWRLDHLSFGETRFVSRLPVWRVVLCYLRFGAGVVALFFLVMELLGAAGGFLESRYPDASRALLGTWNEPTILRTTITAVGVLTVLAMIGAMRRYFVERGVWVAVMSTLSVTQPQALIERLRYCEPASAGAGEGLADAFALGP